jgi:hypothetical protein
MIEHICNAGCNASVRVCRFIRTFVAGATLALAFLAVAPIANAQVVTAVEYYNASLNHYFVTVLHNEVDILDDGGLGGAWKRTGYTFDVWSAPGSGRSPICRYFSEKFDTHFYGRPEECDVLATDPGYTPDWKFEAWVFYLQVPAAANPSCGSGATTLYRLYNNGQGGGPNHRYTTSTAVVASMHAQGWISEGVGPEAISACLPLQTLVEPKLANGVWTGTTSLNEPATVIVETDGTFYVELFKPGSTTEAAIVYGKADVSDGQFNANAINVPVANAGETNGIPRSVAVSGTYVTQDALHLTMSGTAGARTLDAAYQTGSGVSPSVAAVAGGYAGFTGHAGGRIEASMVMQADGTFFGGNGACSFAGTLAPRSDVYAFDYTLHTTGGSCVYGEGTVSGIAYQAPGSKRLLGAARFPDKSGNLFYLLMTKP